MAKKKKEKVFVRPEEEIVEPKAEDIVEKAPEAEVVEAEEAPAVENDIMPSEVPTEDRYAAARAHYKGQGSVDGSYNFDDIPGSIAARSLEEAFEKWIATPGIYRVPGSH